MIGPAPAKINLALVVGPLRPDAKHELLTVYQRVDLVDRVAVTPARETTVAGYAGDTLVRRALDSLRAPHGWEARIWKRIPVAAGLGGGSSDAATALRLANAQLTDPLAGEQLHAVAASLGADVPFFLADGPALGSGDGTELERLALPQDYAVLLFLPHDVRKLSTTEVYAGFDEREGAAGFAERAAALRAAVTDVRQPHDLAALPPNDLVASPLSARLRELGAFRADVSGAGPALYALFDDRAGAARARHALRRLGRGWVTIPAWYG